MYIDYSDHGCHEHYAHYGIKFYGRYHDKEYLTFPTNFYVTYNKLEELIAKAEKYALDTFKPLVDSLEAKYQFDPST